MKSFHYWFCSMYYIDSLVRDFNRKIHLKLAALTEQKNDLFEKIHQAYYRVYLGMYLILLTIPIVFLVKSWYIFVETVPIQIDAQAVEKILINKKRIQYKIQNTLGYSYSKRFLEGLNIFGWISIFH